MDDLISRQAAIDALARTAREAFNLSDEYNQYLAGLMDGESAIRQLPSAQPEPSDVARDIATIIENEKDMRVVLRNSEQPEIIYCKDCKYSKHWYRDKSRCFLWHESGIDVFDDGFCNYAERRKG